MKAIILAGGYGKRLRPLTFTRPKSMLPLLDKPILQHIVEGLANQGFDEIIVTTNYLRKQIIDHFGDGEAFGVKMTYPREDEPLGTAGSVKNAEEYLDETFVVVQGDGITDTSLKDLMSFHKEKGAIATLALTPVDNPSGYGVVELDSNAKIVRFREKPRPEECFSNLVNTGLYVLEPEVLEYIPAGREYDFARDLFPKLLAVEKKLYGHEATGFWVDVGRPEKYMEAIRWALGKRKKRHNSKKGVKIDPEAKVEGQVILGHGCRIGKNTVVEGYSVIERDVEVADGARITSPVIYHGSTIGHCSHINNSIIAEECRIDSHVKIEASVVGAACKIGDESVLRPGSKIWPRIEINPTSTLSGMIQHS